MQKKSNETLGGREFGEQLPFSRIRGAALALLMPWFLPR
jgi:hypothetical protein